VAVTTSARPEQPGITRRDVLLSVLVGVVQIGLTILAGRHQHTPRDLDVLGGLLLAVGPVALVARRQHPVAVLYVAFAGTLAYRAVGYPNGPIYLSLIVAYVNAVVEGHSRAARGVMPIGYLGFLFLPTLIAGEDRPTIGAVIGLAAWLFVLAAGTELIVSRRQQAAEQQRARIAEAKRLASDERLRIAREVHDVVAHNVSLINVQAGVALHLIDEQPERAGPALAAIKQASKETLDELRSVIDALRGVDETAPRAPTPGLDDVERLVMRTSDAGLPVRLERSGLDEPVPAGVELAAYRIVQEALTNATRHAGASSVTVRLVQGEHDLTVDVEDDGRGVVRVPVNGTGSGIAGMRERATALGGEFEAGPRPGRGFRVHARLPLDGRG
jgi:signal transduction histidine kinase